MADTADKIKLVPNRVERAKSFLLYQFQDKVNINKIVEALVEEIQEVEGVLIDLQTLRTLENAQGAILDNIGNRLKVSRSNLDDADYKTAIKVRILRKSNKGTYADISNVFRLLTRDPNPIIHQTHPYVVELTAVLSCIATTSSGLDEILALFPVNTGVRVLDKPKRPFGFANNPDAFPLSSILFTTPQGQMSSLIRTHFGLAGDTRFQTVETFIPPLANLPNPTVNPFITYTSLAEGSVLTINDGTWTGDTPITFIHQWLLDGNAIDGATNTTYTLLAGDINKAVSCRVVASNPSGTFTVNSGSVSYTVLPSGGVVDNLGLASTYTRHKVNIVPLPANAGTSTFGFVFGTDGIVTPYNDANTLTPIDYLVTTGVSAAADYEIYVWQPLTASRTFSLTITHNDFGAIYGSGEYIFTVRQVSTGDSKQVQIQIILGNELESGT
jgi:hypothetical protein